MPRNFLRRLAAIAFAGLVAFGAVGATPATVAAADLTIGQAENEMVKLLNAERAKAGLVRVRVDSRLMSIARKRSADMAARHYFSHTQPDGRTVFDLISAAKITWYGAGEIIAWNSGWGTLLESAQAARDGWMKSAGHRAIVMSNSYNYVGIGLAIDASNGKRLWTGVFMKGPDRTGGYVKLDALAAFKISSAERYRNVTVSWKGGDIRLVVLTAGFRHYQVQVRTDGGAWSWWSTATTSTSRSIRVWRGHEYDMRIRACDKAGNCGGWATRHLVG
jgi:uncharacterized protein YkwD